MKKNQVRQGHERKGRFKKQLLSLGVAATLLLNPLSPLIPYLTGGMETVHAYNTSGSSDFWHIKIMNKQTIPLTENSGNLSHSLYGKWSVADNMKLTGKSNVTVVENRENKSVLSSMYVKGKGEGQGDWSLSFSDTGFDETGITDDVQIAIRAFTYYQGTNGYLTVNPGTGRNFKFENVKGEWVQTDWMPYNGMNAVITGGERTDLRFAYVLLADLISPGEDGWEYEVTNDPAEGAPILWLRTDDLLRTSSGGSMGKNDFNKMKVTLGIVPKETPTAELSYVTAQAVGISDDCHGLGFQVLDDDWEKYAGQEYQVVTVTDCTEYGWYSVAASGGMNSLGQHTRTNADTCVTDLAGNGVYLKGLSETNVRAYNLQLDMKAPEVSRVKISGTSVDSTATTPPGQWPEDIDRRSLFSTAGDMVQFSLQLSEQVIGLSDEQLQEIVLQTNLSNADGSPVTAKLSEIQDSNADGSNGNIVSTLIFEPIAITEGMEPQGGQIKAASITGMELLKDYSKNAMAGGTTDLSALAPNIQNYLDTEGPTAELLDIIPGERTETEADYTVAFQVKDGEAGELYAGVSGSEGRLALTSYENAPQIRYAYEVTREATLPENLTKTGIVSGGDSAVWSSFSLTGEGVYYLHLKLTGIEEKELLDAQGLGLSILLEDVIGNEAQSALSIKNLDIDSVAPELTVIPEGTDIERAGAFNTVSFRAQAAASDRNGLDRMEYQWVESGASPADNGWQQVNIKSTSGEEYSQSFTASADSVALVSRDLYVRVFDVHGNMTEKQITMTADPGRAVGQYIVSGNPQLPSDSHDVLISRPLSTSEGTGDTAATRALVSMGDETYVGVFSFDGASEEPVSLMDETAADWYQVTVVDGVYTSVTPGGVPQWGSYYGTVEVTLYSSLTDSLVPVENEQLEKTDDFTGHQDAVLTFKHASRNDGVYSVSFGAVQDAAGQTLERRYDTEKGISYSVVNQSLAGTRYFFDVSTLMMPEWKLEDMDFEASYAVVLRADNDGNILDEEASARIPLSRSASQVFSFPAADKDGNAFATGVYAVKVHIAQKEGGTRDFYGDRRFVLDASEMPVRFGVFSYSASAAVTMGTGTLDWSRAALDGQVLTSVNIGVARPDRYGMSNEERGNVVEVDGHPGYVTEVQNSLQNSSGNGSFTFNLLAELPKEPETYIGYAPGKVAEIRYWNAASTGDPSTVAYKTAYPVTVGGKTCYGVPVTGYYGWYGDGSTVVSAEALTAASVGDFKVALGSNTICYQLKMENGAESPVYQFQLNLTEQSPTLELSYSYGPTVLEKDSWTGTDIYTRHTDYIDVTVENAFSPNGGVKIYHALLKSVNGRRTWTYEEVPAGETIRLSSPGDGYCGSASTYIPSWGGNPSVYEFICAVDSAGNIMSAYPITYGGNNEADEYYYHVTDNIDINGIQSKTCEIGMTCEAVGDGSYEITIESTDWMTLEKIAESITVQVDGRTPYTISDLSDHELTAVNSAGIIGVTNGSSNRYAGKIRFALPYDSSVEEGAVINHTVAVTFNGRKDETDHGPNLSKKSLTVSAANTKPSVSQADTEPAIGQVGVISNAYVREAGTKGSFSTAFDLRAYENGSFHLTVEDPYGQTYEQTLELAGIPEDPQVSVSTEDFTKDPVTVTVNSQAYTLGVEESSLPEGTVIEGNGTGRLVLTVPENGSFSVYYALDKDPVAAEDRKSITVAIDNIYNKEILPAVVWDYYETVVPAEGGEQDEVKLETVAYGEARAVLVDENGSELIDPRTGTAPVYVFVPGGETEYTFSGYVNQYGMKGEDFTVTLPVTLLPYPDSAAEKDTYRPDLALTGYSIRNGVSSEIEAAYLQEDSGRSEESNVGLSLYGEYGNYEPENVFEDVNLLLAKFGWAESYLFRVDIADESAVRLFIKKGADGPAPDYETGTSDSIPGVTLQGRTLQAEENAEFTLFAVDEKGNSSSVYLELTNLGEQPEPGYVTVLTKNGDARIYLLPPNMEGASDLQITNDDDNDGVPDAETEDDEKSRLFGFPYLSVVKNGILPVHYSYVYEGTAYTGTLRVEVSGVDENPPSLQKTTWSANYDETGERFTNQDISLQMQFDKALGEVELQTKDGLIIGPESGMSVSWMENRATIVFEGNIPEDTRMKVTSAFNGKEAVVDIPAVTTIDKRTPEVTVDEVAYGPSHRTAQITIRADETGAILQENGKTGTRTGDATVFTVTVRENGTFTYTVVDKGGNKNSVTATVTDLVTDALTLELSTAGTEGSIIDPESYKPSVGEVLYARTNRASEISVNGGSPERAGAGEWVPVVIGEDAEGLYPSVYAVDDYGNGTILQLLRIPMGDRTAPRAVVNKSLLSASVQTGDEELEEMFKANLLCSDDTTPQSRLIVEFSYSREGNREKLPVSYTVRDEAGNETSGIFWLRLYDGTELQVAVDGKLVTWDETVLLDSRNPVITVTSNGERYKVDMKAGIKTAAQLKTGAVSVSGYTGQKEKTLDVTFSKPGYYTFCLTTQGRKTYRFVVYVEE